MKIFTSIHLIILITAYSGFSIDGSGVGENKLNNRFYRQRSFWETVVWARCQLNCYEIYRNQSVSKYVDDDIFDVTCTSKACSECLLPCNIYYSTLPDCLELCVDLSCEKSCEYIERVMFSGEKSPLKLGDVEGNFVQNWTKNIPKVMCSDIQTEKKGAKEDLIIYLGWESIDKERHPQDPFVFYLIEMTPVNKNMTNASQITNTTTTITNQWATLGKSMTTSIKISSLSTTKSYKFRVTPITSQGIIFSSITSKPTSAVAKDSTRKSLPPRNVKIVKFVYRTNLTLDAIVTWSNSEDQSCYYSFFWFPTTDSNKAQEYTSLRVQKPTQRSITLKNLTYGWEYVIDARSNNRKWQDESLPAKIDFKTPSCLGLSHSNFSKCGPVVEKIDLKFFVNESFMPSKINSNQSSTIDKSITNQLNNRTLNGHSNLIGRGPIILFISWTIPDLSEINKVTSVVLEINRINLDDMRKLAKSLQNNMAKIVVSGNTTYLYVNGLEEDSTYRVILTPVSTGGQSKFVQTFQTPKVTYDNGLTDEIVAQRDKQIQIHKDLTRAILTMIGIFASMISIATALYMARRYKWVDAVFFGKQQKKDNARELREVNQFYGSSNHGPIAKELVYNYWFDLNRKFDLNSCQSIISHVNWEHIKILGEIGNGAFGKVLKGAVEICAFKEGNYTSKNVIVKNANSFDERKPSFVDIFGEGQKQGKHSEPENLTIYVAIKVLKDLHSEDEVRDMLEEIWLMSLAGKHPNIVNLLGYSGDSRLAAIMEYCRFGCLHSYLRKAHQSNGNQLLDMTVLKSYQFNPSCPNADYQNLRPLSEDNRIQERISQSSHDSGLSVGEANATDLKGTQNFPAGQVDSGLGKGSGSTKRAMSRIDLKPEDILSFARQIAAGMDFLASKKLIHRDLAARNILVCDDKVVKIADFGLARDIYAKSTYFKRSNGKVPMKWMSPESLINNSYTIKSDVWSYGILLWEMVTFGAVPYPGIPHIKLAELLLYGYRMYQPKNCDDTMYQVMQDCWNLDPDKRPSFNELREKFEQYLLSNTTELYFS